METNNDIFMRVLLNDKIKLEPKYMSRNFKNELSKRLTDRLEGKCTRHGYVRKGSIEIYKVTPGIVEMISLNGNIQYDIYFHAEVCNPMLGSIVKAKVSNINKFGILAEAGYNDPETNEYLNILEIIIAKNSVNIVSDVNLEEVKIGDEVRVEIMGKKYELNDKQISVVGRIVAEAVNKAKNGSRSRNVEVDADAEDAEDVDAENVDEYEDAEDAEDAEEDADVEDAEDDAVEEYEDVEDDDDADEKSVKGGNLFSDDSDDLFEDDDEYDMYNDEDEGGDDEVEEEI
jgi:DNA-directed RNA polymerase subunit E'/Rpb7